MDRRAVLGAVVAATAALTSGCTVERVSSVDETSFASDLARAECAFVFSCECEDYGYPDEAFCRDSNEGLYEALVEPARKAGLTFNPGCAQEIVDEYGGECSALGLVDDDIDVTCSYCNVYYGDKAVGEVCTQYADFDDCADGLYCDEGSCVDPCAVAGAGEACESGSPTGCEAGHHCPLDGEAVCTKTPTNGEACTYFCVDGSYCTIDGVCTTVPERGEACPDGRCAEGSACSSASMCIEPPGPDEPCAGGECSDAAFCDYGGAEVVDPPVCRARLAVGEECETSDACESRYCDGTVCVEEQAWICG